jgi:hypothetical protein
MTEDKATKRAIRRRMAKTGERYTPVCRNVVKEQQPAPPVADPASLMSPSVGGSGRAGTSDS